MSEHARVLPLWVMSWTLIVGIVVVYNLFLNLAATTLFPDSYDRVKVCPREPEEQLALERKAAAIESAESCLAEGGRWYDSGKVYQASETVALESPEETVGGSCDLTYACTQAEETIRNRNGQIAFLSLATIAVITLALSLFGVLPELLGTAFAIASILHIFIISARYWQSAGDLPRLALLGLFLLLLVFFALKFSRLQTKAHK